MKIAAVLIVKNEEKLLPRCLESVSGVDEIIIADTGSEDKTVEIAKQYTDKVFTDYKWEDSFCKARNHAKSKVSKDIDWILSIDADEYLVNSVNELRNILKDCKQDAVNVKLKGEESGKLHSFPRLFKNSKDITWVGDAHNALNIGSTENPDITIIYGDSPAHKKDPDRTLRILIKSVANDVNCIRERYYLAREYFYRHQWRNCLGEIDKYLSMNWKFRGERADGYLLKARCHWNLQEGEEARVACMYAILINPDFEEALRFMAEMNYEPRKSKWLQFAELATNNDVVFNRMVKEQPSSYYDNLFEKDKDMSRYRKIYKTIGRWVGKETVLDIGCGLAELSNYVPNYSGFDFSKKTIESIKDKNVWVGDAYEKKNYKDVDTYVCTEVLEHLDDKLLLKNVPSKKRFIFSVPSFSDASHLRTYTEEVVRERLPVDIKRIYRFNWNGTTWSRSHPESDAYILLVDSIRK